jgi:DNA-binding transcriptional LysR family regulator
MADIRATPVIHLTAGNVLRTLVDRALEQAGADGSPIGLETDEYGLILSSVHRNLGFVCMFMSAAQESPADGLVQIPLDHPLPALQVRHLMRHSAGHDALLIALRDALGKPLMPKA